MKKGTFGWYSRGYLPHCHGKELLQFITIRLFDSLPQTVLRGISISKNKNAALESFLDRGIGACFLKESQIAEIVLQSLHTLENRKVFLVHAYVIMPNHMHLLIELSEPFHLADVMKSFKGFTAYKANQKLNRKGNFWMKDYFDRYIRDTDHYQKVVDYIHLNPVKAKLCRKPFEWKYSSANKDNFLLAL